MASSDDDADDVGVAWAEGQVEGGAFSEVWEEAIRDGGELNDAADQVAALTSLLRRVFPRGLWAKQSAMPVLLDMVQTMLACVGPSNSASHYDLGGSDGSGTDSGAAAGQDNTEGGLAGEGGGHEDAAGSGDARGGRQVSQNTAKARAARAQLLHMAVLTLAKGTGKGEAGGGGLPEDDFGSDPLGSASQSTNASDEGSASGESAGVHGGDDDVLALLNGLVSDRTLGPLYQQLLVELVLGHEGLRQSTMTTLVNIVAVGLKTRAAAIRRNHTGHTQWLRRGGGEPVESAYEANRNMLPTSI